MSAPNNDNKKIAFGFKALKKAPILPFVNDKKNNDIQQIELFENNTMKIIGEKFEEERPLVIPMKQNRNKLQEKLKQINNDADTNNGAADCEKELSIEELAARELVAEAHNLGNIDTAPLVTAIPLAKDTMDGEPESTLDDYENVPIEKYGLAMLRGMGWKETEGIGKNKAVVAPVAVNVRPKGLGLGADRTIKNNSSTGKNEELKFVKNAYVRINTGRHRDLTGQIQGFDDESGSVIIKSSKGDIVSLSETFITLISQKEFEKSNNVLNIQMIADFKRREKEREDASRGRSSHHGSVSHSSSERDYKHRSHRHEKTEYHSSKSSSSHGHHKNHSSDDSDHDRKRSHKHKKNKKHYH